MLTEIANTWVENFSSLRQLKNAVYDRLIGTDVSVIGNGKEEEYPEDVIVTLLTDSNLSYQRKMTVVAGWSKALSEVKEVLELSAVGPVEPAYLGQLNAAFSRLFTVIDLTGCPLLRYEVWEWFHRIKENIPNLHLGWKQEVAAAALSLEIREDHRAEWEFLLDVEDIASYAFRALLKLDANSPKIPEYLATLFEHQYKDNWRISAWFLAEYVKNEETVKSAFSILRSYDSKLVERIIEDLKNEPDFLRYLDRIMHS